MERAHQELTLPRTHLVDKNINKEGFEERVDTFLASHPDIVERAKEEGQDIVAIITTGTRLLVGRDLITEAIPAEGTTEEHIHDHKSFVRALKNRSYDLKVKISGPDGKKVLVKTAVLSTALLAAGAYLVYKHQHDN